MLKVKRLMHKLRKELKMTTLIKHKRVEFSELFMTWFCFAISKVTTLIDHLHSGILTWNSFLDFS